MIVVSDTSPISNLFMVGKLDLLPAIFEKIIIPSVVMSEILALEKSGWDLSPIKNAAWIEIRNATDQSAVTLLMKTIHRGESEAIVLASEIQADYLLMDESNGRKIAMANGLKIIGLLGILLEAKEANLIAFVKPFLDDLIHTAKFRVKESLYHEVLKKAGE